MPDTNAPKSGGNSRSVATEVKISAIAMDVKNFPSLFIIKGDLLKNFIKYRDTYISNMVKAPTLTIWIRNASGFKPVNPTDV
ncbi:MAG: hypothetical protein QXM83_03845, partial [Ignisphaera sp.]